MHRKLLVFIPKRTGIKFCLVSLMAFGVVLSIYNVQFGYNPSSEQKDAKTERHLMENRTVSAGKLGTKVPPDLQGLITSMKVLRGRHSDFISPECQKSTKPLDGEFGFLGPFDYLENYKNPCWISNETRGQLKCVPYFYLIGAPKAGSTDLFWRIKSHPHVVPGKSKEIKWFDRQRFDNPDMKNFNSYTEFFARATSVIQKNVQNNTRQHHWVIGDGSPSYYYGSYHWRNMPGNEGCTEPRVTAMSHIHHLWPKAKLILLLRNPVNRLYSFYLFNTRNIGGNKTAAQFDEWARQSMDVWNECLRHYSSRHCMYDPDVISRKSRLITFAASIYSRYVLDILKLFPKDQLLVVNLEEYSSNKEARLKEIYDFLELEPLSDKQIKSIAEMKQMNIGRNYKDAGPMWPQTRALLQNFYAPYNRELAAILGDNNFLWSEV